ncbi:Hypothetical predicted protein, partial [Olea europaea subsp. europaea]
ALGARVVRREPLSRDLVYFVSRAGPARLSLESRVSPALSLEAGGARALLFGLMPFLSGRKKGRLLLLSGHGPAINWIPIIGLVSCNCGPAPCSRTPSTAEMMMMITRNRRIPARADRSWLMSNRRPGAND